MNNNPAKRFGRKMEITREFSGRPISPQAPDYVPNVTRQREGACYSQRSGARVENGCASMSERSTCRKVDGERVNPRDVDPDPRPR
jgi:hypothetical protein